MADPEIRGGIRSLALGFPSVLRTNDHYRKRSPELVARAEEHSLARIWSAPACAGGEGGSAAPASLFEEAMAPYLSDPFRGAEERRVRGPGETALGMELEAARGALSAASLTAGDIDLALVSSFVGDRLGVGNAPYVAKELGLGCPALNFESACAGSVVGLELSASLLRSGDYRRILVICSTSNSVQCSEEDTVGWFVGDGAAAFVVEPARPGHGVLGWKTVNTVDTNDMFVITSVPSGQGTRLLTVPHRRASAMARETAERYVRTCIDGALKSAGVQVSDIDFWVFQTPNAWYADFCGRVVGVGRDRYHSIYKRYANIGMTLMPATLYHALEEKRISPGDLVAMYAVGSTSTASAAVMRIGEVALGPPPTRPAPA